MDYKDPNEHKEQVAVVNWLEKRGYLVFAVPNGFQSDARTKKYFKDEGLRAGVNDLMIALDGAITVFLEMKTRTDGRLSKSQKEFHSKLIDRGHIVLVGYGAKDAMEKLGPYLK